MGGNKEHRRVDRYMRPREAAQYVGLSVSTLAKLRMRKKRTAGPVFIKVCDRIVYRQTDLDAWMTLHEAAADGGLARG